MNKTARIIQAVATALALSATTLWAGEGNIRRSPNAVAGEYIVVLNDDVERGRVPALANALAKEHGGRVERVWQDALKGFFVRMTEKQAFGLSHNPHVKYIEENAEMFLSERVSTKIDPACTPGPGVDCSTADNRLWHLDRADQNGAAPSGDFAWCNAGTGQYVYVVDTGVARAHREFNNDSNRVLDGHNAGDDGNYYPAYDPCHGLSAAASNSGHGTGVASLVAGRYVGLARGAKIVPVKVANCGDQVRRDLTTNSTYATGEIVAFNSTSYICRTGGTTTGTKPPPPYPWDGDPGCGNGGGFTWGTACFDYRGHKPAQTVQMVIEGVDWILRASNPNPKNRQVATFSTFRMASGPDADAATRHTIAGRSISFEEAVRNLVNAGITVIASANNQNANACDTSPARLSRNSPVRPAPTHPDYNSYKVITVGGSMLVNNPDGPSAANGGALIGRTEPAFDNSKPVRDARWLCADGDSDNCDGDPTANPPATGNPSNSNYARLSLGSNGGQCVTLFAPAKNINVANIGSADDYRNPRAAGSFASGTSWSAPIVAAMAARILAANPAYGVDDVYNDLIGRTSATLDTATLHPPNVTGTPNALLSLNDVVITQQPGDRTAEPSGPTTLTVTATGSAPLTYEWYQVIPAFDLNATRRNAAVCTVSPSACSATLVAGQNTNTLSVTPTTTTGYFARVRSACGGSSDSNIAIISTTPPPPAPTGLTAEGVFGGTSASLTWNSVSGASGYRVERKAAGGSFTEVCNVTTTGCTDGGLAAGNAYLYRVRATAGSGQTLVYGAYSPNDIATTVSMPEHPPVSGVTTVKASHVIELRHAVNALCDLAGRARIYSGTALEIDSLQYTTILAATWNDLRSSMNSVRTHENIMVGNYAFGADLTPGTLIDRGFLIALRSSAN